MFPTATRPRPSVFFTTILTLTFLTTATSITFELGHGQRKCFFEDLPPSSTIQASVYVASGKNEMSLDLFVSDPRGKVLYHRRDVNSAKFSFTTPDFQQHTLQAHRFCVLNQIHPHAAHSPTSRRITLNIRDMSKYNGEQHVSKLAKQEHADKVYADFLSISQSVDTLIGKMDDMRSAEQTLTDLNERTATTIVQISLVACFFTIGTGVLNFLSLKSFFKRKKLA